MNTAHIHGTNSEAFIRGVQRTVNNFQSDGYEVEVQYAASANQYCFQFSALVIAKRAS